MLLNVSTRKLPYIVMQVNRPYRQTHLIKCINSDTVTDTQLEIGECLRPEQPPGCAPRGAPSVRCILITWAGTQCTSLHNSLIHKMAECQLRFVYIAVKSPVSKRHWSYSKPHSCRSLTRALSLENVELVSPSITSYRSGCNFSTSFNKAFSNRCTS